MALTDAERRHPRPGTGTGDRGRFYYRSPYYGSYYGSHYYPYWGSLYFGYGWPYDGYWGGYYGSGYYGGGYDGGGYYGYPNAYRSRYRDTASIRLQVQPDDTRVYVDGYYAGVVDDFDGLFQRLHVTPGRHEIALKHDGYRTHRIKVYAAEDNTLKIRFKMEKGAPSDETVENLAGDDGPDADREPDRYRGRDPGASAPSGPAVAMSKPGPPGHLRLEIRPEDASVYVDGTFRGTAREAREIELPAGSHRVEVVRPGFRTEERDVDIDAGRSRELDLELERR